MPPGGARPEVLAISANQLHGLYFEGGDKDFVASLREVEPLGRAGYSIWLYRMDTAIEQLRRRVESSGSARNHYFIANLLNHQGLTQEAIDHYREAVRIDPGLAPRARSWRWGLPSQVNSKRRSLTYVQFRVSLRQVKVKFST